MKKVIDGLCTMAIVAVIAAQWGAILYWAYGIDDGPRCRYEHEWSGELPMPKGEICPEPKQPFVDEEEEPKE